MRLRCRLGFHDWYRVVSGSLHKGKAVFGKSDHICIECHKLSLELTEQREMSLSLSRKIEKASKVYEEKLNEFRKGVK